MKKSLKKIIVGFTPPIFLSFLRLFLKKGWHGNYQTWEEAKKKTTGYNHNEILNKVYKSSYKVKAGQSKYERDGVLFEEIQYSWPLIAGIMLAAVKYKGEINVIDFGGSLGSTYFQNKKFIDHLSDIRWCIVEQEHFVRIGKQNFEDERLKFYSSIDNCIIENSINILILSSVIEYLEDPFLFLTTIIPQLKVDYIIIDRTPFTDDTDRITVQTVPNKIYKASYPCHIFNQKKFCTFFSSMGYTLLEEFESINDERYKDIRFMGFIYIRNDS